MGNKSSSAQAKNVPRDHMKICKTHTDQTVVANNFFE